MKQHWYFQSISFCVLCGLTDVIRERRYGAKPKNAEKRYEYHEVACDCHFL